jgi:uncharacterized LabA/DUF88 family protein
MNKKTLQAIKANRTIHLIDIENLCGSCDLTIASVENAREAYFAAAQPNTDDLFVIAASNHNQEAAAFGWPNGKHVFRSGQDGADIELALVMINEHLDQRFQTVVLASGDGGLAPFAEHLIQLGSELKVVSLGRCLSHQLRALHCPILNIEETFGLAA